MTRRATRLGAEQAFRWIDLSAGLVAALHSERFFARLDNALQAFIPNQCCSCYTFPSDGRPVLLDECNRVEVSADFEGPGYLRGPYLIDPFYLAAQEGVEGGCFRVADLVTQEFEDSDYSRYHYLTAGMVDELGVLFPMTEGRYIHLSLSRDRAFSPGELDTLKALYPTVRALMIQQWAGDKRLADVPSAEREIHAQVQRAFSNFGTSMLTQREAQIAQLILAGNSTRHIGERLDISAETVKVHRRHIYTKLDISSQTELFSLFINCMSMATDTDTDPLHLYHSQPADRTP